MNSSKIKQECNTCNYGKPNDNANTVRCTNPDSDLVATNVESSYGCWHWKGKDEKYNEQ